MAWVIAVNGGCLTLKGMAEVKGKEAHKALQHLEKTQNLTLQSSYDNEADVTQVYIGKELHASRHLYAGKTVTLDNTPMDEALLFVIKDTLGALKQESGLEGQVEMGFVLNQFD